jgi:hypothetical protein
MPLLVVGFRTQWKQETRTTVGKNTTLLPGVKEEVQRL